MDSKVQLLQNARDNLDGSTEMDFATCFQGIKPISFQKPTFENGLQVKLFTRLLQFSISSYHETFLKAEEECNKVGGYLADVLDNDENNWIKSVLNVINPKDGTDYWLGGLDANRDGDRDHHGMYWMTGNFLNYLFNSHISTI